MTKKGKLEFILGIVCFILGFATTTISGIYLTQCIGLVALLLLGITTFALGIIWLGCSIVEVD